MLDLSVVTVSRYQKRARTKRNKEKLKKSWVRRLVERYTYRTHEQAIS